MPAGYDAEVAELFRDLRSASSMTESDLAARLATRVEVVQALEQGALYALPPWAETCRVVNGYGAMLNLDVRPLLRRIYAQLESGIVELGPKPIPDVPVMAGPEPVDFGRGQNRFEPKFETNNFEARPLQANSFEQRPVEPNKGAAPRPSGPTPDWPENPFAKPKPGQPQAAPKPPQGQWPQTQPASAPQQTSWPTGPGSPFQATWPNAAPQGQPKAAPQGARPNGPSPQMPQAPWVANPSAQRPMAPQQPQGQAQPPRPQPRPAQAQTPPPRPQPQQPKPPSQADLQTAWQQAQQLEPQTRAQPVPPPPAAPLQEEEKPSRKRGLLKWGVVLLLLAIMAGGGYLVLNHLKAPGGLQSSTPANLDPDDPRSRKADKLQGPS
ncbi:MAG: hypothetical protein WBQ82_13530 [Methyloceanibacter sp.]